MHYKYSFLCVYPWSLPIYLFCVFLSEDVQCLDVVPPHLGISIPDFLGVGYKDEEDEESLEGHHDGVDVGQRDQLLHFHY